MSDDFFRKPSKKEITEQYSKMEKGHDMKNLTKQLSIVPTDLNKTATPAKSESAKPSIQSLQTKPTTVIKLKKYAVGEEENRTVDKQVTSTYQIADRLVIDQRTLDFSNKNRFKTNGTSAISSEIPIMMKLPTPPIIEEKVTKPIDADNDESIKHAEKETGRGRSPQNIATGGELEKVAEAKQLKEEVAKPIQDCSICCAKPADAVCLPCGHSGLCRSCAKKICVKQGQCFLCKKPVDTLLRIDPTKTVGDMVLVVASVNLKRPTERIFFD